MTQLDTEQEQEQSSIVLGQLMHVITMKDVYIQALLENITLLGHNIDDLTSHAYGLGVELKALKREKETT